MTYRLTRDERDLQTNEGQTHNSEEEGRGGRGGLTLPHALRLPRRAQAVRTPLPARHRTCRRLHAPLLPRPPLVRRRNSMSSHSWCQVAGDAKALEAELATTRACTKRSYTTLTPWVTDAEIMGPRVAAALLPSLHLQATDALLRDAEVRWTPRAARRGEGRWHVEGPGGGAALPARGRGEVRSDSRHLRPPFGDPYGERRPQRLSRTDEDARHVSTGPPGAQSRREVQRTRRASLD